MSKGAKRLSPVGSRPKPGKVRSHATLRKREGTASVGVAAGVVAVEGRIVGVGEPGTVRAVLAGGETIEARCPAHIDAAWVQAACTRAPVDAVFVLATPSRRHIVWGVFPGAAHADVRADVVIRGRQIKLDAESLELRSRNAHLDLETDGNVLLKGRDVTSHARRVNRIKGGSIRLN